MRFDLGFPSKVLISREHFQNIFGIPPMDSVFKLYFCRSFGSDSLRPCSSVHGILQARVLEWVAISFSRGSSWPRDWTWVFCIAGGFFTVWATLKLLLYYFFLKKFLWKWGTQPPFLFSIGLLTPRITPRNADKFALGIDWKRLIPWWKFSAKVLEEIGKRE